MCISGQRDRHDNEYKLREHSEKDLISYSLVGVNPNMKALQRPQRLVRKPRMNKLERIWNYSGESAEQVPLTARLRYLRLNFSNPSQ